MCHSTDSRPPAPPDPGPVAEHEPVTLTSADGSRLAAHVALPARPPRGRMVVLPDVRGLHPYYRDLVVRFAEAGFATVAIDWFGRTTENDERGDDFPFRSHLPDVDPRNIAADVSVALEHLAGRGATGPAFTAGFCFGGSMSWRLSAGPVDLSGVIGFYGRPALVRDVIPEMRRPLLLLIAGNDSVTPAREFEEFTGELAEAGVPYEARTYPGAPHSFFDRAYAEWGEACADAWRWILDFTGEHGAAAGPA
ncbi:dienelactone hydrolase family protein [Microtetraspora malaysiensis]|uniref:dienelactone hydrolase family protein n=1 Tax=Microtetraspora malaysiensis TaxID=161358 RepID=UPI003D8C93B8